MRAVLRRSVVGWGLCITAGGLVAQGDVASTASPRSSGVAAFSTGVTGAPPVSWRFVGLPKKSDLPATRFEVLLLDGQRVLKVQADASYGNLVHDWQGPVRGLQWRWRLDKPLTRSNLRTKEGDDVALKLCVMFDLPTTKLALSERLQLSLARAISREALPAATLCYVWDRLLPVGTVLANAYTRRVRYLVVDSGESPLRQWVTHQRDVPADFLTSFGAEADSVPLVTAIVLGADTDNTGDSALGYVGDVLASP